MRAISLKMLDEPILLTLCTLNFEYIRNQLKLDVQT